MLYHNTSRLLIAIALIFAAGGGVEARQGQGAPNTGPQATATCDFTSLKQPTDSGITKNLLYSRWYKFPPSSSPSQRYFFGYLSSGECSKLDAVVPKSAHQGLSNYNISYTDSEDALPIVNGNLIDSYGSSRVRQGNVQISGWPSTGKVGFVVIANSSE